MALLGGLSAWFGQPGAIRDDVVAIRSERLRRHASMAEASMDLASADEADERLQREMRRALPSVFVPDARHPRLDTVLSGLRGVGYEIVPYEVAGEWQDAYRRARAANPGQRVIMVGWGAKEGVPALGYVCTGTEGGDVAIMTAFDPMKGTTLLGRLRCRTHSRLLRLEGTWVDRRATCTIERWRDLPPHMRRQWGPREGQVASHRGEEASAFLERVAVAEIERQVRMVEKAGKVDLLA